MHVNDLMFEYINEPIGIDSKGPRLSWDISENKTGIASGIYFARLLVSGNDGTQYTNHKKLIVLK